MSKSVDAFRTISEVAKELGLATHVLRFWESKFPQIKPLKRAGGRRYYRPEDVILLRRLQELLHDEGYTIKGVQKLLREEGVRKLVADDPEDDIVSESEEPNSSFDASEAAAKSSQGSLFDTHQVASPSEMSDPALEDSSLQNTQPENQEEERVLSTEEPFSLPYSSAFDDERDHGILPEAPEPEPVLSPDAPQPQIIVKHALSPQQRNRLQEILAELQDMKTKSTAPLKKTHGIEN